MENSVDAQIKAAVEAERARCIALCDDLASRWEKRAMKTRERGTTRSFWNGKPYVIPSLEAAAKSIEAAAYGLRTVERGIREGWGK